MTTITPKFFERLAETQKVSKRSYQRTKRIVTRGAIGFSLGALVSIFSMAGASLYKHKTEEPSPRIVQAMNFFNYGGIGLMVTSLVGVVGYSLQSRTQEKNELSEIEKRLLK